MSEKPNDTARLQFLAVLEYLLTQTDEDHLSSTNDIANYAEEHYGVSLRRDQTKPIVEHIYELCKTHKKVLPYEIKCSGKTKVNKRYYCAKKKFDIDVIVKVCAAIANDKTINNADSDALIKQLVNDYVVADKQKLAKQKIGQRNRKVKKMNTPLSRQLDAIYDLELTRNIFEFALNSTTEDVFESSSKEYTPDHIVIEPHTAYRGVVIKVEEERKTRHLFVYIYLQQLKGIIKTSVDNLTNINDWGIPYHDGGDLMNEEAQLMRIYRVRINRQTGEEIPPYGTVQTVLERRWGREAYACDPVTFKFCINSPEKPDIALLNRVKDSFEKFFNQTMQYEQRERRIIRDEGTANERELVALDVYVTVNTDFFTFKKWVTEEALILDNVVVMSPEFKRWNDRLVAELIERFAKRLNKYGFYYKYTINKELTDEAREEEAQLEREYQAFRAELEARRRERAQRREQEQNNNNR